MENVIFIWLHLFVLYFVTLIVECPSYQDLTTIDRWIQFTNTVFAKTYEINSQVSILPPTVWYQNNGNFYLWLIQQYRKISSMTVSDIAVKNWINCPHVSLNVRKRTFEHMRPAKIQIRLRIRAVWSESSLGAVWMPKMRCFFMWTTRMLIRLRGCAR